MPAAAWHSDASLHLDKALRDDVRLLGEILGRVIAADRGQAFVDRIERIRALAKAARSGGGAEWDALSALLESIPADAICDVARAFNQFLNLANIAEQQHAGRESGGARRWNCPQAEGPRRRNRRAADRTRADRASNGSVEAHAGDEIRRDRPRAGAAAARRCSARASDRRSVAQRRSPPRTADAAGRSEMGLCGDRTVVVGSVAAFPAAVRREPDEIRPQTAEPDRNADPFCNVDGRRSRRQPERHRRPSRAKC